jgi:hypothetical protein
MAGIDKIYGTQEQYFELRDWAAANKPQLLDYMGPVEIQWGSGDIRTISNFTCELDDWLWSNCPIEFVRRRLADQYNRPYSPLNGRASE